jgi:hypothetical protein
MAVAEPSRASTLSCGQCGAALAFEGVRSERCPYCASPNVALRPASREQPDPQFVVTFVGDAAVARRALDRWLGGRTLFADAALARARVEDLRGIYVPAYLYSAVASTDYTAQIGENYTETERYTTRDSQGNEREETRTVTRTEYRALAGRHVGYVADVVVSASAGLTNAELQAVEPFDLKQLRRYAPALVAGWIAEEFARERDACLRASRGEATDQVGEQLRHFMPGDSYSDLTYRTTVSWESLDPIFVPVWVFAVRYRDDKPPLRVVINGQTGAVAGRVPLSFTKIALAVLALLGVAAAIWLLVGHR